MDDHSPNPATCATPPDEACAEELLSRFAARMIADEIPWRRRIAILGSARQFLEWWRAQYRSADPDETYCAGRGAIWSDLREAYLREVCPDRELRAEERACLNGFLRFVDANGQSAERRDAGGNRGRSCPQTQARAN